MRDREEVGWPGRCFWAGGLWVSGDTKLLRRKVRMVGERASVCAAPAGSGTWCFPFGPPKLLLMVMMIPCLVWP